MTALSDFRFIQAGVVFVAFAASGCRHEAFEGGGGTPTVEATPALIAEADRRFDFGFVVSRPGRRSPHAYRLTNTTTNVVNLLNVINYKTCCGSVRAEKLKLDPGESAEVEVTLHLDNQFGDVVNTTEVVTDLASDERIELRTSATTVPFLRVEPASTPDGPILAGSKAETVAAFEVFAAGDASEPPIDLDVVELDSTIPVEWTGPKQDSPSEDGVVVQSRVFRAALDATGEPGERRAEVVMRKGSDDLFRHVVSWTIVAPIAVAPEMIVLKSGGRDHRVTLKSRDQQAFRVTRIECDAPEVHGRAASGEPALTQVVEVEGDPKPGTARGVVSVFTDHPTLSKIEVPFIVLD